MYYHYDEDEYETVTVVADKGLKGFSVRMKRRSPEEILKIKLDRKKAEEDEILRKAELIRRSRQT